MVVLMGVKVGFCWIGFVEQASAYFGYRSAQVAQPALGSFQQASATLSQRGFYLTLKAQRAH